MIQQRQDQDTGSIIMKYILPSAEYRFHYRFTYICFPQISNNVVNISIIKVEQNERYEEGMFRRQKDNIIMDCIFTTNTAPVM